MERSDLVNFGWNCRSSATWLEFVVIQKEKHSETLTAEQTTVLHFILSEN